jgi:LysM repeat protein
MRQHTDATALERVKMPRLGRSLSAAALFALVLPFAARAQDVRPDAATHVVKKGDTLWDLANTYLGDAYLWPEIYRINTDQIDDPHWIYPGEVLRLPVQRTAAVPTPGAPTDVPVAPVEQGPRRVEGPTIFRPRTLGRASSAGLQSLAPPPRVPLGDVTRAPYFDRDGGPRGFGRVLFAADLPGIEAHRPTANFQVSDRILIVPPASSLGAVNDRYVAYALGPLVDEVGQVIIPSALLRVVRPPVDGEAAVAEVLELYSALQSDDRLIPWDTAGAGANVTPVPVPVGSGQVGKIRSIQRPAELPSLDSYLLFDLSAKHGLRMGDEVEIFHPRDERTGEDGPSIPEVSIGRGQVVKVTPYGATARVTAQEQPAIKEGESVRIVSRMP